MPGSLTGVAPQHPNLRTQAPRSGTYGGAQNRDPWGKATNASHDNDPNYPADLGIQGIENELSRRTHGPTRVCRRQCLHQGRTHRHLAPLLHQGGLGHPKDSDWAPLAQLQHPRLFRRSSAKLHTLPYHEKELNPACPIQAVAR